MISLGYSPRSLEVELEGMTTSKVRDTHHCFLFKKGIPQLPGIDGKLNTLILLLTTVGFFFFFLKA